MNNSYTKSMPWWQIRLLKNNPEKILWFYDSYINSSLDLINTVIKSNDTSKKDSYGMPIFFLIQHSIELFCKYCILEINPNFTLKKLGHDLKGMWEQTKRESIEFFNNENKENNLNMEEWSHDEYLDSFLKKYEEYMIYQNSRYPLNTQNEETVFMLNPPEFDWMELKNEVENIRKQFMCLSTAIDVLLRPDEYI